MASIVIAGDVGPETKEMVEKLINGKISWGRFFKFLSDNGLERKVTYKKESVKPSAFDEFTGDILSTIFNIPEEVENEDKKEKCDTLNGEDKALKIYRTLMNLRKTYRKEIPELTPENIFDFITSLNLPVDKIKSSYEKAKSYYYKMRIYRSFEEFEDCMKEGYGIDDVWDVSTKDVPEWFESMRDTLYKHTHTEDAILIDEDEFTEFRKWKEKKETDEKKDDDKESYENHCRRFVNTIICEFSPILSGKALKHFENMYKSNNNAFMGQLRVLYNAVKSAKNDDLICFIDVTESGTIVCNPIPNTKKDIEKNIIDAVSKPDSKESSDKKSSTSKKTSSSTSAKDDKLEAKNNADKSESSKSTKKTTKAKTDSTDADLAKQYDQYVGFILTHVKRIGYNAKEALLLKAKNLDKICEKLYVKLNTLIAEGKQNITLIYYFDDNNIPTFDLIAYPVE